MSEQGYVHKPYELPSLLEVHQQSFAAGAASRDTEVRELREKLEAAERGYRDATQTYVDRVIHYRNLAIMRGAKPDEMLTRFDADLARQGIPERCYGCGELVTRQHWQGACVEPDPRSPVVPVPPEEG